MYREMAFCNNEDETAHFLPHSEASTSPSAGHNYRQQRRTLSFLLVLNVTILFASVLVNVPSWRDSPLIASTDLDDARSAIEYEQRTYTGALDFDETTRMPFRRLDAEQQFFGSPSSEIDDAWAALLHGEFPILTASEAQPYEPELRRIPQTKNFHFEPDVFHSLHCLNAIRLELSETLYNVSSPHEHAHEAKLPANWRITHAEHCMDRIRQALMCHGDLTPSPMYSWPGFPLALGRSGKHMCRKWEPIRDWMDQRAEMGPVLSG